MNEGLIINTTHAQGRVPVTVFVMEGALSVDTTSQFLERAQGMMDDGTLNLLLDFGKLDYISSAGLRSLHQVYELLVTKNKESRAEVMKDLSEGTYKADHLKILNPSKQVFNVLKMGGFDMYIEILTDFQNAVDAFQ
jgi:anti-anti-sigma regulatory factor